MTPRARFAISLTLVGALSVAVLPARENEPSVSVLEFELGEAPRTPGVNPQLLGRSVADLLIAQLASAADLRVIERSRLRDLPSGDAIEPQLIDYVVVGSVAVSREQKKHSGSALAIGAMLASRIARLPIPVFGSFSSTETHAHVALAWRVVETRTGRVIGGDTAEGDALRKNVGVGGFGVRTSLAGGSVNAGSAGFDANIFAEATRDAVKLAADGIEAAFARRH